MNLSKDPISAQIWFTLPASFKTPDGKILTTRLLRKEIELIFNKDEKTVGATMGTAVNLAAVATLSSTLIT